MLFDSMHAARFAGLAAAACLGLAMIPARAAWAALPQDPPAADSAWQVNDDGPLPSGAAVPAHPAVERLSLLGRRLFFDRTLSASGRMACASCHDPRFAYGPPNGRATQLGGADLRQQGVRAAPSLRYIERVPLFTEHYFDEDVDESIDNGPTGGLTWDGRATNPHEQARIPLLSPLEMANASTAAVVRKVERAPYAAEFRAVFGHRIFRDTTAAFAALTRALETFLDEPAEFFPYSSKYDAMLRGEAQLSARERRGLELFNNPAKGDCARCHPSTIGQSGGFPAFTDFGYAALAVPRNAELSANRDPAYFDLGLCGPYRTDLRGRAELCGMFRVPTLRNVTLRGAFFHNGRFHDLKQVLEFYVARDIDPARWYVHAADGAPVVYDDLPPAYRAQVSREPPLDRGAGREPALSAPEIEDIIAFLGTLTDGWAAPLARR